MRLIIIALLACQVYASTTTPTTPSTLSVAHPLSDDFINIINKKQTTWIAGRNFADNVSMNYIKRLMGVLPNSKLHRLPPKIHELGDVEIPEEFDSRKEWSFCPTLQEIRDQGSCGSCWAFGAVEAMSDRVCIHSKGKVHFRFSAEHLVSCCVLCGMGCNGGFPGQAWRYWVHNGIVSGGSYGSNQGCQPYEIAPCEHHVNGTRPACEEGGSTPKCHKQCEDGYRVPFKKDLHFGKDSYSISSEPAQIQQEIMTNGPVEGAFTVYSDLLQYKDGKFMAIYLKDCRNLFDFNYLSTKNKMF